MKIDQLYPLLTVWLLTGGSILAAHGQQMDFHTNSDTSQILLEAEVNHQKGKFLFDNAAELSVIFLENEDQLNDFKVVKQTFVTDSQGEQEKAYLVSKVKLRIRDIRVKEKIMCLAIVGVPKQLDDMGVIGILGANFVNQYDWKINFKDLSINTLKRRKSLAEDEYYSFSYFFNERRIASTIVGDSSSTDTFQIDLGYNQSILVSSERWISKADYVKVGVGMSVSSDRIDTTSIEIKSLLNFSNSLCVRNIPLYYRSDATTNLIGVSFLNGFEEILIINSTKKIYLKKTASSQQSLPSVVSFNNQIMSITKTAQYSRKMKFNIGDTMSEKELQEINEKLVLPERIYDVKCLE